MEALSSMDRVKQVEAIQGYNSMKSNLMEYLKKFAENGKVVRQEDIQEFFQQMQANKRPRVEIPKFCKWFISTVIQKDYFQQQKLLQFFFLDNKNICSWWCLTANKTQNLHSE